MLNYFCGCSIFGRRISEGMRTCWSKMSVAFPHTRFALLWLEGNCSCLCSACDIGVEHDDHTCYSCEQRLLHPDGVPGAPWQPPLTPGCESWCAQCTSQRCAVRGLHELHVCMGCEHTMKFSTPVGGGDPWAAPE